MPQQLVLPGQLTILHSGAEYKMVLQTSDTCSFVGTYAQTGQLTQRVAHFPATTALPERSP